MNVQARVAYRNFQVAVLVALLAALLLTAAPAFLQYLKSLISQLAYSLFVLGQMSQGVIIQFA